MNCNWQSLVCCVVLDKFRFPFMIFSWYYKLCVKNFYFDSPMYFSLHMQSSWSVPGLLFDNTIALFLQENLWNVYIFIFILYTLINFFLDFCLNFNLIFWNQDNILIFLKLLILFFLCSDIREKYAVSIFNKHIS